MSEVIGFGEFGEVCSILAINDINGNFGFSSSARSIKQNEAAGAPNEASSSPEETPRSTPGSSKKRFQELLRFGSKVDADDTLVREIKPEDLRALMAARSYRAEIPRYAVKRIASMLNHEIEVAAVLDLASEAKFLAHLNHSNIIKVRATAGTPGTIGFMIVLDRLFDILPR